MMKITKSVVSARKHQLDMYTVIPTYITPVCCSCHSKIHADMRKQFLKLITEVYLR